LTEKKKRDNRKKRRHSLDLGGMFKEKKTDLDSLRANSNLPQRSEKKKEARKSARTNRVTDKKKSTSSKETEKVLDSSSLEEIVQAFQKELNHQNELLESMKEESIQLKRKIQEEKEKCTHIMEQFELDISSIRKSAEEERKERRQLQQILDNIQNNLTISSLTQTNNTSALPSTTKNKNKRLTKKKQNPT